LLGGCDVATPDAPSPIGPPLHIVGIYPADGFGDDCTPDSPPECGVALNTSIVLRFDRYLDPSTANRQALSLSTGALSPKQLLPKYDPIERVLEYRVRSDDLLLPRTLYHIEFAVPAAAADFGFRAFDGAPLAEGDVPLRTSFFSSQQVETVSQADSPSCETLVSNVLSGSCGGGDCHASRAKSGAPPQGLVLESSVDIFQTAIGRVAHQTELGDRSGVALAQPARFGVEMPLIDPKNPGNSYLMYKLLRLPGNFEPGPAVAGSAIYRARLEPCLSAYAQLPLPEGACLAPSDDESARLREWFVRGEPMPLQRPPRGQPVYLQGLRAISGFIAAGADCDAAP
jgi:hypothetical protein